MKDSFAKEPFFDPNSVLSYAGSGLPQGLFLENYFHPP